MRECCTQLLCCVLFPEISLHDIVSITNLRQQLHQVWCWHKIGSFLLQGQYLPWRQRGWRSTHQVLYPSSHSLHCISNHNKWPNNGWELKIKAKIHSHEKRIKISMKHARTFNLGSAANLNDSNSARQFGQSLLHLFTFVVGFCAFDASTDEFTAFVNGSFLSHTIQHNGIILCDCYLLAVSKRWKVSILTNVLQFESGFLADYRISIVKIAKSTQVQRIHTGSYSLATLRVDGTGKYGSSCGSVSGNIVGFGSDALDLLSSCTWWIDYAMTYTHVLMSVKEMSTFFSHNCTTQGMQDFQFVYTIKNNRRRKIPSQLALLRRI